ncbi:prephenate/arogenate dehydrogenase family protein [Kordiimonas sp. SCSIO 12610]|uniref:prephenate/arogenate dehydrogenase family protein n=1 Tax=Kordiimonas sp. SCSIO 12610 TaxID=2829597 RepID=UPI00210D59D3|nr:prephenate/arogenate dehydrogenase family protein [Kordiimonas sp. SCSIO 12610]UTW55153.1 prephenate/arogenate dehydrogenase family protein [Kordiimonas sp. SCSIO 12610]
MSETKIIFNTITIIGAGLIGSSLARAIKRGKLAETLVLCDQDLPTLDEAKSLALADVYEIDARLAVEDADLVVYAIPVGVIATVGEIVSANLKTGAIISDVGSVKKTVLDALTPFIPDGVHLVPGHPVAGTEQSGPSAGFASLFDDRWCILTPDTQTDDAAVQKVEDFWRAIGSKVEIMDAEHHDLVLAITSHVPHLIAYNIVGTASDLEAVTRSEVIKYSAGGFRDFTRIAASDPTMWRDVFLNNKEAVLEMLGRFSEDLTALQRAIRWGDGDALFDLFSRTRDIRRKIIDAGQETADADFGRSNEN